MDKRFQEREFVRIRVEVDAEAEALSSGERRTGRTECVSMNGLFFECADPFPIETQCRVTLLIGGAKSETRVSVKAKVAYVDGTGMGFQIISHLCLESYGHLYRLVLYNAAEDAELVEEEVQKNLKKIQSQ